MLEFIQSDDPNGIQLLVFTSVFQQISRQKNSKNMSEVPNHQSTKRDLMQAIEMCCLMSKSRKEKDLHNAIIMFQ